MVVFLRTQVALIIGSLADFGLTILLVDFFHAPSISGSLAGNIAGAIFQFTLSRNWVFDASEDKILPQLLKFILVWGGHLLLSAAGMYLFNHLGCYYLVSKILTSVLLGTTYVYFMKRHFVFA